MAMSPKVRALCDGCNVREPFEHRCHGAFGPIAVWGEMVEAGCNCAECVYLDRDESLSVVDPESLR